MQESSTFVLVAWSLLVICYDICTRTIPNFLSLGALLIAFLVLAVTGLSVTHQPASSSWIGFLVAMALTLPGYLFKVLGAGDVKLLAAIGLLCGFNMMLTTFALASISVVLLWLLWTKALWLRQILPLNMNFSVSTAPKEKSIPFGAALGAALIAVLLLPGLFSLA